MSQSHQSKLKELKFIHQVSPGPASIDADLLPLLIVEARQAVYRGKSKEEEHGVEEDEAGDDHPCHVYRECIVSLVADRQQYGMLAPTT